MSFQERMNCGRSRVRDGRRASARSGQGVLVRSDSQQRGEKGNIMDLRLPSECASGEELCPRLLCR